MLQSPETPSYLEKSEFEHIRQYLGVEFLPGGSAPFASAQEHRSKLETARPMPNRTMSRAANPAAKPRDWTPISARTAPGMPRALPRVTAAIGSDHAALADRHFLGFAVHQLAAPLA